MIMSDMIKYKEIQNILIQENGIIRNSKGRIIARLVSDVDFNSEHINDKDNISDCTCLRNNPHTIIKE